MDLVHSDQVLKAVRSLIKFDNSQAKKTQLIDDPSDLLLSISLTKIPEQAKLTPIKIALKHSLRSNNLSVCLFTKDPQKDYKALLQKDGITCISKVIGISKLRAKYKPYEAKRLLCQSYDLFLADERILPLLPKLLGKEFFKKKKLPYPVNLVKSNLGKELALAIHSTSLTIPTGSSISVKIGHCGQNESAIVENVMDALPAIVSHIPKQWKNIQALYLKTSDSIALPIFNQLPEGITAEQVATALDSKTQDKSTKAKATSTSMTTTVATTATAADTITTTTTTTTTTTNKRKLAAASDSTPGKKSVKINDTPQGPASKTAASTATITKKPPPKSALKPESKRKRL